MSDKGDLVNGTNDHVDGKEELKTAEEMAPALDGLSLENGAATEEEPKEPKDSAEASAEASAAPAPAPTKTEEREVVVQLADGTAGSLYAGVNAFEDLGLSPDLLKGLYGLGFQRPSKIQEKALPLLLANPPKNLIGQSQSGTGKTAAFALAMLSRIDLSNPATQALCLSPARELARQSMDVLREMGKYTAVTTAYGIRDAVARGDKVTAQIVIGTPGTVGDLIKRRALDVSQVKMFVLDEADNMLDAQGLGDQSVRIKRLLPKACQVVLFSATFPDALRDFAANFAPNANKISLKQEELSVEGIKQFYMDCKDETHKTDVLCAIYGLLTIGQSIIFVRRRDTADALAVAMTAQGHAVTVLHGKFDADQRDKVIDDFREGRSKVLITTNVIARGIDILQVNLVINFDLPLDANLRPDPETYLHRIGRTGRFGRTGVSINFVHDEKSYREMKEIETYFGRDISRVPTANYMDIEKYLKKAVK